MSFEDVPLFPFVSGEADDAVVATATDVTCVVGSQHGQTSPPHSL